MAIKVIVNYPSTPEGMEELKNSYARTVLGILNEKIGPNNLNKLVGMLSENVAKEKQA